MVYDEQEWANEPKLQRRSDPAISWFWAGVAVVLAAVALFA